jgi:hypothetical protein
VSGLRDLGAVIAALDEIVHQSAARGDRHGYFPALYRATTVRVQERLSVPVADGGFVDPGRLAELDVRFAGLYLRAEAAHRAGRPCPRAWSAAFEAEADDDLLIVQHLLLGMNAHINLDLGPAAARTSPGELPALRHDYLVLNDILKHMVDEVQEALRPVSPWMAWIDRAGGRVDEALASFSLRRARDFAWDAALELDAAPDEAARERLIARLDGEARALARAVAAAPVPLRGLVRGGEVDARDPEGRREVLRTLTAAFPA